MLVKPHCALHCSRFTHLRVSSYVCYASRVFHIYMCASVCVQRVQRLERQHCMRNGAIKFDCSRIVRLYTSSCGIRKSEMRLVIALVRIIIFLTRVSHYIYIKFQIHRIFLCKCESQIRRIIVSIVIIYYFLSKILFGYFTFFFPLASPKHFSFTII